MATTPVTSAQWHLVHGSPKKAKSKKAHQPIVEVSWDDAMAYCRALSETEGLTGDSVYRLPTEAEWEYACRAGSVTRYCNGDSVEDLNAVGWHDGNSKKLQDVAGKEPNAWGIYDMHGNVIEWCHDWFDELTTTPVTDPAGPTDPIRARVYRGGSFFHLPNCATAGSRFSAVPETKSDMIGFRVVSFAG